MKVSQIVVTGAGGFIGRHLVEALLADGESVLALCRPSSRLPQSWQGRVERVDCGDWSLGGISAALGNRHFGFLFHLAAYGVVPADRDPATMHSINGQLPADLVRLCANTGASMVMAGSNAEYRRPQDRIALSEQSPLESEKAYGASKAQGSMRAIEVATEMGAPLRVLRLFNVYGPGEAPHRLLPSLVEGLSAGRRIALSEGSQVRDFVYVGDVVEAFRAAADHVRQGPKARPQVWNVATGTGHTVREFAEMTARLSGGSQHLLGFGELPMRPDEIEWLVGDPTAMKTQTGWSCRYDLAAGIEASLERMIGAQSGARAVR